MLHLYENPLSPYAQKIKIALHEKEVPFETSTPNLLGAAEPEFRERSPLRQVPTLVDGDLALHDSTIILEYIEERWPTPPLLPAAPAARARARMIEEVCDTQLEAAIWAITEIRFFRRATGDLGRGMLHAAARQIRGLHGYLERQLGAGPFFDGDAFGRADISVFPHIASGASFGIAPAAGSPLAGWFERAMSRASTQRCLASVAEVMTALPDLPGLVASGSISREYRDHRLEWMLRNGGAELVLDGVAKKTIRYSVEIS
jgi:glutathione S-transferase/RNA polymerase-associated protein